jgi:hypothetical protein
MTGNSDKIDKRLRLIDTASKLTYERGFTVQRRALSQAMICGQTLA